MVQSPSWEANCFAASHFTFHRTRRFITALTSLRHPSLSWASPIQSIYPHPTPWRSILILSTYLRLDLPSGLIPSGFPSKTLYTPLTSPIRATCPAHLILLNFITRTILGEEYKSFSSSLCSLLHSPVTSSFLSPNIVLNTMFSNTLSFLSSRNVNDQVAVSCILSIWPGYRILWPLMNLTMFSPFIITSNSSFRQILHNSFSVTGPYIFRNIFLLNAANALSSSIVSIHDSEP